MENNKSLNCVDVTKLIMSFCVIGIHSYIFDQKNLPSLIDFIVNLAVPFFIITSGWLYSRNYGLVTNELGKISPLLAKFELVSVREKSGVKVCEKAGIENSIIAPDPTLLFDKRKWSTVASKGKDSIKYCVVYFVGSKTDISFKRINSLAKQNKLKVIYIASQNRFDFLKKTYPSIPEWLHLFANAEYIFTNSFHGTIFSLIFNKPFTVFPLSGITTKETNTRVISLLDNLHHQNALFSGDLKFNTDFDWEKINGILEKDRKNAKKVITEVLSKTRTLESHLRN